VILIGQYDSPFVRRVAVAMGLYGMSYEHRPWSVFADADRIAEFNPLRRVPTLVTDDGEALVESSAILDWLDEQAGPDRALIAASGPARRHHLRICALAGGLADKTVSLIYERAIHGRETAVWVERCRTQIAAVLDALESDRAALDAAWWFGESPGHADIFVGCALRILSEALPGVFDRARWPALADHAAQCEALPAFKAVVQPFHVTPPVS
jgi:glutathione S-transferase